MSPEHSSRRSEWSEAAGEDTGALMKAVADASPEALGVLYDRFGQLAFRTAYRITGSVADAEDVVHDVFVGLPRAALRYEERGAVGGWLRTLVIRTALMRLRNGAARQRARFAYVAPEWVGATDPVDLLALRSALQSMPEPLRVVFMLKEVEGYGHAEIAQILGISQGACRVRLHRAWGHLRERMGTG